jgi:hypothetical protein
MRRNKIWVSYCTGVYADVLVIGSMMLEVTIQLRNDWTKELGNKKQALASSHRTQAAVQRAREKLEWGKSNP